MQHHGQGHIYRAQDASRVINAYGRKPQERIREQIQKGLAKEKDKFMALEQIRSRPQQQQRGRSR